MRSSWLLHKIPFAAIADTDISFSEYQCEHGVDLEVCVQGSAVLVAAGMVVATVVVGPKGGEEIVVRYITSLRLRRGRHLPFNLPKAHSTTTCALLRLVLNFLSFGLNPAPGYGFISHGSRGDPLRSQLELVLHLEPIWYWVQVFLLPLC